MSQQQLLAGYGQFIVDSADFDGSTMNMMRGAGLSGAADSKTGIFSCWIRIDGGDGAARRIFNGSVSPVVAGPRFSIQNVTNALIYTIVDSAGATNLQNISNVSYVAGATWRHFLAAWDLANLTSSLWVTDTDVKSNVIPEVNANADYTIADWAVGIDSPGAGSPQRWNGCMAELYFAPGQYLDFSTTANRRLFISAAGKPIYLGATGELPTGTSPIVYLHLGKGEAIADFAINRGTGGNFTITGALAVGSTSPSD